MQTDDFVYGLAVSPDFVHDRTVFAARSTGLYESTDGGATWRLLYGSLRLTSPLPTAAVAASPAYVSDHYLFAGVQGAVVRSFDRGQTWQAAQLASPPPVVTALVVSPDFEQDGVVFAGTAEDGVFRSKDRGSRWGAWNFGLLDLNTICLVLSPAFGRDRTIFVGTESGIFRSTNGGRAWRDLEFSEDLAPVQCLAISPGYVEDGMLLAGTESCGLFMSRDWGESWRPVGGDRITGSVIGAAIATGAGNRPRFLVLTDDEMRLSNDGGATWQTILSETGIQFTTLAAPAGLGAGSPVLAGAVDGQVLRASLPATT
jgi:photosystem II stability/assembly factor-like uncharacterized protein